MNVYSDGEVWIMYESLNVYGIYIVMEKCYWDLMSALWLESMVWMV